MYKKILKNIEIKFLKKEKMTNDLLKAMKTPLHPIHDKIPHIILSAEDPHFDSKTTMSHEDAMDFLKSKGYDVENLEGRYDKDEKSILVKNPPKHTKKHLLNLAQNLGQESVLVSDGYNHELHYVNGAYKGLHHKGSGTILYEKEPTDRYSKLEDGTYFSHNIDFDKTHKDSKLIKGFDRKLNKSENSNQDIKKLVRSNSGAKHDLELSGFGTKLIHYSPKKGLKEIDPDYQGVRRIGSESRQGKPKHSLSFYYAEGVTPEDVVTSGTKSKYVVDLGDKKLYDIGKDPMGLYQQAKVKAQQEADDYGKEKGWGGRQIADKDSIMDIYHQSIKDNGYHGIYNSGMDKPMSYVVGMYYPMQTEVEHNIHPNDFKKTSAKDHFLDDKKLKDTKEWTSSNGGDATFLHNLIRDGK